MRILLAGDTYPPDVNGAGVLTRRLAEGLASRRHDVHVMVPSPANSSYEAECGGIRLHYLASHRYPWHPTFHIADFRKLRLAVSDIFQHVIPDVVHVHAHFAVGRFAAAESRKSNTPLIATNHFIPENVKYQLPFELLPEFVYARAAALAWWDLAKVFRSADVITAPTPYAVDVLRTQAGIGHAIPVSCGVDVAAYGRQVGERDRTRRTVLFVGRLDAEKHIDEIIDALALMDHSVRLRIVGRGRQEKYLRRHAAKRGVDDRVTFVGYLSDDEVRAEYSRADVFCMPGTAELQSIATLEAMASGLPVVAAAAGALPYLVRPGVNGALFPPGDVRALADALQYALDEDNAKSLRDASRLTAQQHDFKLTLDAFERIYLHATRRLNARHRTLHYGLRNTNKAD
ncbi:glycosyltransferase [Mycobacterium sp.]|jgi:glycosyltransferase involved in cell wall biosynthesis|uniref:glycosyltransferase n=1 Tax=Mycobacterium sp. TaxID=1785 RepID=UPI002D6E0348|nr:glycosyltransferase [Mycobacterium sp.]HZA11264.1 glycosyltransferase [Mycobacterium sp.]